MKSYTLYKSEEVNDLYVSKARTIFGRTRYTSNVNDGPVWQTMRKVRLNKYHDLMKWISEKPSCKIGCVD